MRYIGRAIEPHRHQRGKGTESNKKKIFKERKEERKTERKQTKKKGRKRGKKERNTSMERKSIRTPGSR